MFLPSEGEGRDFSHIVLEFIFFNYKFNLRMKIKIGNIQFDNSCSHFPSLILSHIFMMYLRTESDRQPLINQPKNSVMSLSWIWMLTLQRRANIMYFMNIIRQIISSVASSIFFWRDLKFEDNYALKKSKSNSNRCKQNILPLIVSFLQGLVNES